MTKAELIDEVSRVSNLTKKHAEVIVDTVFDNQVNPKSQIIFEALYLWSFLILMTILMQICRRDR